jgi:hypothetical protein
VFSVPRETPVIVYSFLYVRHGAIEQVSDLRVTRPRAPMRAESPASSMGVATNFRKLCDVTAGTPRPSRTTRHAVLKFCGPRSVPLLDAKIVCCWPTYGRLRGAAR